MKGRWISNSGSGARGRSSFGATKDPVITQLSAGKHPPVPVTRGSEDRQGGEGTGERYIK